MKRVKFGVSRHSLENAWREWPEILHADVSWPPSELISYGSRSVDFCNFGTILTKWDGSNLGFPGISWRTHGGNGLKYGMLLYPDHLQNWLAYHYSLLIFVILALFWLSETGQIWGFQAFLPLSPNWARGVLSSPAGRAGGRYLTPLPLSRAQFLSDRGQTWWGRILGQDLGRVRSWETWLVN